MSRYRNVCWTLNNPEDMVMFDHEAMDYLVYQEEMSESGTYHFQGYCEFSKQTSLGPAKELLGGPTVHLERRRGTQEQAIAYCKDPDKRIEHTEPYEEGEPRHQGKRVDLEGFKDAVMAGERQRDLVEEHYGILARYPRFYGVLKSMNRPGRSPDLAVTLLIGPTGTGKTRYVEDMYGADPEFYRTPLDNKTIWYDGYDGHTKVLLDDFTGAASHISVRNLLRLLDRYTEQVPTKGGHTWWVPDEVFVTTNLLPRTWYDWKGREEQYDALARRFTKVLVYFVPMPGTNRCFYEADPNWWQENRPDEAFYSSINGSQR